jgi:hypothetical protein
MTQTPNRVSGATKAALPDQADIEYQSIEALRSDLYPNVELPTRAPNQAEVAKRLGRETAEALLLTVERKTEAHKRSQDRSA